MNGVRHIVFPGRFQPVSIAHVHRIQWLRQTFPSARITIVIGDTGSLNRANFLLPFERVKIFECVLMRMGIDGVCLVPVVGTDNEQEWARRVLLEVPDADAVASDNPFATRPLARRGLQVITYVREGIEGTTLRAKPFTEWIDFLPDGEFELLCRFGIRDRIEKLEGIEKYPFERKPDDV